MRLSFLDGRRTIAHMYFTVSLSCLPTFIAYLWGKFPPCSLDSFNAKPCFSCEAYIWASFVVWGFDRLCRWIRYTLLSNVFSKHSCRAYCELLDADTIRISTRRTFLIPVSWKYPSFLPGSAWQAGQHYFLAFPTMGLIESHPMTIANIPENEGKDQDMVWIVRTREGLTRRLKNWLEKQGGVGEIPLMLDGPYGAPDDLTPYNTCIFLAGTRAQLWIIQPVKS